MNDPDLPNDFLPCPYCGEDCEIVPEELGPRKETYVQDCAVCCQPCVVNVERDGRGGSITSVRRMDD